MNEKDIKAMARVARNFLQKDNLKKTPLDSWQGEDRQRVYALVFETMTTEIVECPSEESKNTLIDELREVMGGKNALEERLEEQKKRSVLEKLATWVRRANPHAGSKTQQPNWALKNSRPKDTSVCTDPAIAKKIPDFLANRHEIETFLEKEESLSESNINRFLETREKHFDPELAISALLDDSKNNEDRAALLYGTSPEERQGLYRRVFENLTNAKNPENPDTDSDEDHQSSESPR